MRATVAALASTGLALTTVTFSAPPAAAAPPAPGSPTVVASGLDNPRQLNCDGRAGRRLVIGEAGRGGDTCFGEGEEQICAGLTGAVSVVDDPAGAEGVEPQRWLEGLLSSAAPDGSFAMGPAGADVSRGQVLVAQTYVADAFRPPGFEDLEGAEALGHLLGAQEGAEEVDLLADLAAFEAAENPDGAQIDSNPYAALSVGDAGVLVADAAANAVLRVDDGEVSTFYAWPALPDDEEFPEYVPTSLARDDDGNVYVGGLGSEQAGRAVVTKLSADGELLEEYGGFTGVTGVAVEPDGSHFYVSQLFGTTPLLPPGEEPSDEAPPTEGVPGDVVRVDLEAGTYVSEPVPFPGGVATDGEGNVYVAAHSVSDADGTGASEEAPATPGGQVWSIGFGEEEQPVPVTGGVFPEDTGGEFVPAPPNFYEYLTVDGCGTTLFLSPGDVAQVELRVTPEDDGDLYAEFRGASTVDVRSQDGRVLEEVDASGRFRFLQSADGAFAAAYDGPGLWWTLPEEEEAVDAAGLPRVFTWAEGTLAGTYTGDGELELTEVPEEVTDLCTLLR